MVILVVIGGGWCLMDLFQAACLNFLKGKEGGEYDSG